MIYKEITREELVEAIRKNPDALIDTLDSNYEALLEFEKKTKKDCSHELSQIKTFFNSIIEPYGFRVVFKNKTLTVAPIGYGSSIYSKRRK